MADQKHPSYFLMHPVYLDVQMMVSFLAYIEGGVALEEEETRKDVDVKERAAKLAARFRFRLPGAIDAEAGGDGSANRKDETSVEVRAARQQTAASLFNYLYAYLHEDKHIVTVESASQLEALKHGQVVEIAGEYVGNSFEEVIAFFSSAMPYFIDQGLATEPAKQSAPQRNKRKPAYTKPTAEQLTEVVEGLVAQAQEAQKANMANYVKLVVRLAEDIKNAPVHDLLLRTDAGLQAVLTVSSRFYTDETNEFLRSGNFRVVGKVTRVITGDQIISLARRTVLRAAGADTAQSMLSSLGPELGGLDARDPVVVAPAIQVLPMAIFV